VHVIVAEEFTANDHPDVPAIMLKYADFLKMYTIYINSFESALTTLSSLRDHKQFQATLSKISKRTSCDEFACVLKTLL